MNSMTAFEVVLAGGGAIALAIFGIVLFMAKDVYTKVGELGALKERIRALEAQVEDAKRLPNIVARLEEQIKSLSDKIDILLRLEHTQHG